jgi:hypothetical protein
MSDLSPIIAKYKQSGILVDANLLLLLFIGEYDRNRIAHFKRTSSFTPEDYDLLVRLVKCFAKVISTPHILADLSNLSAQLGEPARTQYFTILPKMLSIIDEHYVPHFKATSSSCFTRLGLTDAGIAHLVMGKHPVVTIDLDLYLYLTDAGVDAINFNHFRPIGWSYFSQ